MKSKVSIRYSKALFLLGGSDAEQEERVRILEETNAFLQNNPSLENILLSPQIPKEEKVELFKNTLGNNLDQKVFHFLLVLLEEGRLKELPDIVRLYHERVKENLGIKEVKLISVIPIDPKSKAILKQKLETYYQQKIEILEEINPEIIGGAILLVGNQMLDFSIKDRLAKLKDDLLLVTF